MPIKTLLAHLDAETSAPGIAQTAISLAKSFSAHLIGLHVVPNAFVPAAVPVEVTGELLEAQRQASEAAADRISAIFEKAVAGQGLSTEWRKIEAHYQASAQLVAQQGHVADLVILGQPDRNIGVIEGIAITEEVMLGVGRPVLIAPVGGVKGEIGKRVLLGWNDSREAARAAFDALPFLSKAESVRILSIAQEKRSRWGSQSDASASTSPDQLAASLRRHGVSCSVAQIKAAPSDVAGAFLGEVESSKCDLVVMGGYGHWRVREVVFGGATRGMLDRTTVPVLMSH